MPKEKECIDHRTKNFKRNCSTIFSTECYRKPVRDACCKTCETHRTQLPGCQFGNRAMECGSLQNNQSHKLCYDTVIRRDCCKACWKIEATYFSGCWYGDNSSNCIFDHCIAYTVEKRQQCCYTCAERRTSTRTATTTILTTGNARRGDIQINSEHLPDFVLPVAVTLGGLLLLVMIIVTAILLYRNRKRKHPSPISDEMYKDYKITKRSPMPEPRALSNRKIDLQAQDSDGYAYIRPNDIGFEPTYMETNAKTRRLQGNTVDFKGIDKDGYITPVQEQSDRHSYIELHDFYYERH